MLAKSLDKDVIGALYVSLLHMKEAADILQQSVWHLMLDDVGDDIVHHLRELVRHPPLHEHAQVVGRTRGFNKLHSVVILASSQTCSWDFLFVKRAEPAEGQQHVSRSAFPHRKRV
eukprot:5241927-Amphidinium_carterae.2